MPIDLIQLKPAIKIGFDNDVELVNYYHDIPEMNLGSFVDDTYNSILGLSKVEGFNSRYFLVAEKVKYKTNIIGYSVLVRKPKNILYTFAINGNHRSKENVLGWLEAVKKEFGGEPFFVKLWAKNERVINMFMRNDFKVIDELSDETYTTLLINN